MKGFWIMYKGLFGVVLVPEGLGIEREEVDEDGGYRYERNGKRGTLYTFIYPQWEF